MVNVNRGSGFRSLRPDYVAFDSWYAGLDNLKHVRHQKMHFLTRLKSNRAVNPDRSGLVEVGTLRVEAEGQVVQLRGFGLVRVFQKADAKGEIEHWATSDCLMTGENFQRWAKACWSIENYHRGLKQCCAVEKAQVRSATGQKNHLLLALRVLALRVLALRVLALRVLALRVLALRVLALRAFLRLEAHRLRTGLSWYQAKLALVRNAIQIARTHFVWSLLPTA